MRLPPHLANFCILVETGFHHVAQAGLELLTSGDLHEHMHNSSCLITGMSHCIRPILIFLKKKLVRHGGSCLSSQAHRATTSNSFSNLRLSR
uniref:Uncharacterized protein n=1 Tax=Theropithecus gelada TaxID=9565 RepID=A0A8D2K153_THEGE